MSPARKVYWIQMSLLKVDLHIHTNFSPDGEASPQEIIARCQKLGLSCIAITDHNTIAGAMDVQETAPIRVIVGEEVMTSHGEVMGLFLKKEIPHNLTPVESMQAIKEQGGLVCVPHPFDRFRTGLLRHADPDRLVPLIDIVEIYNARTFLSRDNRIARDFAKRHNLTVCVGSDAHTPSELGHTYIEMPDFDGTPEGFMNSLQGARLVTQRGNPIHRLRSTYAKLRRFRGSA